MAASITWRARWAVRSSSSLVPDDLGPSTRAATLRTTSPFCSAHRSARRSTARAYWRVRGLTGFTVVVTGRPSSSSLVRRHPPASRVRSIVATCCGASFDRTMPPMGGDVVLDDPPVVALGGLAHGAGKGRPEPPGEELAHGPGAVRCDALAGMALQVPESSEGVDLAPPYRLGAPGGGARPAPPSSRRLVERPIARPSR